MTTIITGPIKKLITIQLEDNTFSPTTSITNDVFNFLKWKQNRLPKYLSINERNILSYNQFNRFYELSSLACSYSKPLMRLYIEHLWQILLNSQYQIEGCLYRSTKCKLREISVPPNTTRLLETLVMSLFYPNNLLFDFLNRYNPIYCVPLLAVKTHRSKVGTLVSIISNHESIVIISTHSILYYQIPL